MAGETKGANTSRRKPLSWDDDRSTDKIYASGNVSALGTPTAARSEISRVRDRPSVAAPQVPQNRGSDLLLVNSAGDVQPVLERLCSRLRESDAKQVVYIKAGDQKLLQRFRTALELAVTRQDINEEMYNDVTLSFSQARAAALPVPTPTTTKRADMGTPDDPLAFLHSDTPDEEDTNDAVNSSAVSPTVVDTSDDDEAD